jgi:hypothetical protein
MTIKDKHDKLSDYCDDMYDLCDSCPHKDDTKEDWWCHFPQNDPRYSEFIDKCYELQFGETEPTPDNVNHPSHYETGKFECIDVMIETQGIEAVKHFCMCNAFKYIYRHGNKNGIEDVKKAIWYLNKYIELTEGGHE